LKEQLSDKELKQLKTSFDIIGDIIVIEIPKELRKKEKIIADALRKTHPHVKTILKKIGEREGKFRLRKFKKIFGEETETIHKEYGCIFKLDVTKVYFSPRESTERQRVAEKIKPNEKILVMFAGVGPYAIIIAKKQPSVKVYAIEINPDAVKYMIENVRMNKVGDRVIPILGDVAKKSEDFYGKCDRVIMPLPKGAYKYLKYAIKCAKPGGVIHFYYWAKEEDLFSECVDFIEKTAKKMGRKIEIVDKRKVLPYGPRKWKICVEFICL